MNNIERMIHSAVDHKARKVMVQLPAGLKQHALAISEAFAEKDMQAVIAGKTTYGACDLADIEACKTGCDLLIHVGHTKFYRDITTQVPVVYVPWTIDTQTHIDVSTIPEKRIGIVTTIQHTDMLDKVAEQLLAVGKQAVIGGQILGCWTVNATRILDDVDALLYVGSGCFHPEGIKVTKPVYSYNVETGAVEKVDTNRMLKKRYNNMFRARDAKTFGILVTTKAGQQELLGRAEKIQKSIHKRNKKAYIIVLEEINDENLQGIAVDAFINTACPRIADDHFSKPFINATDVEELLHEDH